MINLTPGHIALKALKKGRIALPLILLATLLTGCTSLPEIPVISGKKPVAEAGQPTPTKDQIWAEHKERLLDIQGWSMKGKLGVKTSRRGGSASVRWERADAQHDVDISGPFGGGRVRITEDPFGATLKDNKGAVTIGKTAYELLYKQVGWPVPFDPLKYWVVGLPIPGVWAEWEINEDGYLGWLRQAGWEITFEDYKDRDGVPMPRKLKMSALPGTVNLQFPDGETSELLEVKLIVTRITVPAKTSGVRGAVKPAG